jgi:hypothetical protein
MANEKQNSEEIPIEPTRTMMREGFAAKDPELAYLGRMISGKLKNHSKLIPQGLALLIEFTIADIVNEAPEGTDLKMYEDLMRTAMYEVVETTCPSDFTKSFKKVYQGLHPEQRQS